MKVSVIVPTYSPGEYIYECLASIVKQSLATEDFEILIILNGPKEPFYSQLKEFVSNHSEHRFKLMYSDVAGVSNARNIGLDNAQGEFITFIDDDDVISSDYIEGLLEVSSSTCVGVSNGYAFVNDIGEKIEYGITKAHSNLRSKEFSLARFRMYLSPPVYKMIHRGIIGNTRFNTSLRISEDSLFCFMISKNIKKMRCAHESAIYYVRKREGSATRKKMKISYILRLTIKKMWLFTKIYISNPLKYNFPFYVSRLLACIKHLKYLLKYS